MRLFLFIVLSCSFTAVSWAGDFSCPETHPEYNKMLAELQAFQAKLSTELECKEVAVKFDKLTELIGSEKREEILSLVSNLNGATLSAENAELIQNYASAVTEEVGTLVGIVGSSLVGEMSLGEAFLSIFGIAGNRCSMDEEDQLEGIEKLTSAAYEATNLISKVAGPYGVPLQIGVSAVYGVVQGLQAYSERTRNIDFDTFEKRQFFESAVCVMSKFDSDIRKLNNPEGHLRNLRAAKAQAERVLQTVKRNCEDCASIVDEHNSFERLKQSFQRFGVVDPALKKAYEGRANLEWIENEIVRFNEIANFKTGGIGPRDLQAIKVSINKFLMNTAAPDFIDWYADSARESNRDFSWSVGSTYRELRSEVVDSGELVDLSLPKSIEEKFWPEGSRGPLVTTQQMTNYFVMQTPEISNLYFIKQNKDKIEGDSYSFYSWLGESYDDWKLLDLTVRVVQEYCSFFEKTLQLKGRIKSACEDRDFVMHGLRTGYQSFYLASIINGDSVMRRLGPFDFRLEDHNLYIEKYKKLRKEEFLLAEEGLDRDLVLNEDRAVRQKEGRWRPLGTDPNAQDWWNHTENLADQFLNDFNSLR